jgi:hypothetical protein
LKKASHRLHVIDFETFMPQLDPGSFKNAGHLTDAEFARLSTFVANKLKTDSGVERIGDGTAGRREQAASLVQQPT